MKGENTARRSHQSWRVARACRTASLLVLIIACDRSTPSTPSPAQATQQFYAWYLADLEAHGTPLDSSSLIAAYVTPDLLKSIREGGAQPEPRNSDYFLRVQDWPDDWGKNIAAVVETQRADTATVRVTLGSETATRRALLLSLVYRAPAWLIYRVDVAK